MPKVKNKWVEIQKELQKKLKCDVESKVTKSGVEFTIRTDDIQVVFDNLSKITTILGDMQFIFTADKHVVYLNVSEHGDIDNVLGSLGERDAE